MARDDMPKTDFRDAILWHLTYTLGKDPAHAQLFDWRMALSYAVRDRIVDRWMAATRETYRADAKRVYYLSMEFLIGRLLEDNIVNLEMQDQARAAIESFGLDYRAVLLDEPDAALGNGGLGRLAACFMESLATLGCPAYGYGIRYEHGLFRQSFVDGRQHEAAGERGRDLHGVRQAAVLVRADDDAVDHDLDIVLAVFIERDRLRKVVDAAVHTHAHIPAAAGIVEHLLVLALFAAHDGGEDLKFCPLRQARDLVDDLVDRLAADLLAAFRAVRRAAAGP